MVYRVSWQKEKQLSTNETSEAGTESWKQDRTKAFQWCKNGTVEETLGRKVATAAKSGHSNPSIVSFQEKVLLGTLLALCPPSHPNQVQALVSISQCPGGSWQGTRWSASPLLALFLCSAWTPLVLCALGWGLSLWMWVMELTETWQWEEGSCTSFRVKIRLPWVRRHGFTESSGHRPTW